MRQYTELLVERMRASACAEKAGPMEAYMKHHFPFLGLKTPERKVLMGEFVKEYGIPKGEKLLGVAEELWSLPEREFQYIAQGLLEKHVKKAEREHLDYLEKLIVTKSWWDTVDLLASKLVGGHLLRFPELIPAYTERWIGSDNLWLRRTALLFQLGYKEKTDEELLFRLIRRCAHEQEFFIRKGIGWALREYAKTSPEAVQRFVADTPLSPLSVREALKHVGEGERCE
ncbi:DNA alkylation repair protein [Paenibacillus sp. GD4]|uniref:DNA alkylation repair protein n=1 Tax=Paenibacillus sp. GD4 TaxID=3068890 RepID=UPI002796C9BD|nr:DNA alkylation repair protein [Paenibacillus sp. GD4]MDQ1910454.1 DNA alkylation repair protein [Paenibacillus sp. GD4]